MEEYLVGVNMEILCALQLAKLGRLCVSTILFRLHLLHGEGVLERSCHGVVMIASNTGIQHLVTSRALLGA